MRRKLQMMVWVMFSLVLIVGVVVAEDSELPMIELLAEAQVDEVNILLVDVANIQGEEAWIQRLAAVVVGTSPVPGTSRRLTAPQIEIRLRQAGIHPSEVYLAGSAEIYVQRRLPTAAGQQSGSNAPIDEPTVAPSAADEAAAAIPTQDILIAVRNISQGEVLGQEDIRWETVETRTEYRDVGTKEDYLGMQTTRFLRAGARLTTTAVQVPPAISRGDQLWIRADAGGVVVQAPGTARETGGVGETILVINTVSGQRIYAVILDSETVQVPLKGVGTP